MKTDGEVVVVHCTCIAGYGETCSHIGAILFYFEVGLRWLIKHRQQECWLPAHVKSLVSVPVVTMDFSFSTMKRHPDHEASPLPPRQQRLKAPTSSEGEGSTFFDTLTSSGLHLAVAATDFRYSYLYVAKTSCAASRLMQFFDRNARDLTQ